jgi:class 3 adenylate cyclase/tetratricopeptide (TPR) repeat protein
MNGEDPQSATRKALASWPPQTLVHKGLSARQILEGHRRQATVLFTDMASFTPLAEHLGEEKTYLLIQRVLQAMSEAVHCHEGTVQELTGDGLMALFGVPIASENAPLKACRAALDIRSRMLGLEDGLERDFGLRPKFRIGIHTGPLVIGKVGDDLRVEFTALGDTVNLASRLQTEAEPGSILISAATQELIEGLAETSFLGKRLIKGKLEPQCVFELTGIRGEISRFELAVHRGLTAFIGRTQDLRVMEQRWEEARKGTLRVVDVSGEPGIGKSRLAFEFRQYVGNDACFLANCTPSGQTIPFRPFISIVRAIFDISDRDPAREVEEKLRGGLGMLGLSIDETLPYLLALLGQARKDSVIHQLASEVVGIRTRRALSALLRERCRRSPLVLIIEDLHWVDTASEDWMLRIDEDARELPLLIIATFRPHYRPPWANLPRVANLVLQPLSDESTIELFKNRIGISALPGQLAQLAVTKTQGNPLFAEEITNYLIDRGRLRREGTEVVYEPAANEPALPITLENLLLERFDRLDEGARGVLEAASVIGPSFSRDLISEVTGLNGAVMPHLAALESKELIFRESHGYRFKHALVQDAVYNRLLTPARQELHERAAEAIERQGASNLSKLVDDLADHYKKTARAEKTVHYMALAGAKSLQVYSLEEAEKRFRCVIDLIESVPGCADDTLLSDVLLKMARLYYYRGQFYNIISLVERYLPRVAAVGDKRRHSRLLFELGYSCVFSAQGSRGKNFLEQALALAEELEDDEGIGYACLGLMFFHLFWGGSSDETRSAFKTLSDRVSKIAPTLQDVWLAAKCLNCRWAEATFFSRFSEARELCLELFALSRATGDHRPMGFGLWQMAITNLYSDQYMDATENARQAQGIALAPVDRLCARSAQGGALALLGRAEEALAVLGDVRQQSEASGFIVLIMMIDVFYGASMSLAGELGAGVRWIHEAIRRIEAWGNTQFPVLGYMILGEIYLQMVTSPKRPPLPVLLRNFGFVVTNVPVAALKSRRYLEEAIRRCRAIDMPGHLARCLLDIGMLHKAAKRIPEARACFIEALAVAESVRAGNIAVKVKAALEAL